MAQFVPSHDPNIKFQNRQKSAKRREKFKKYEKIDETKKFGKLVKNDIFERGRLAGAARSHAIPEYQNNIGNSNHNHIYQDQMEFAKKLKKISRKKSYLRRAQQQQQHQPQTGVPNYGNANMISAAERHHGNHHPHHNRRNRHGKERYAENR